MITKASEKGQALILITLAAVGLFSFAALAIDGTRVFSEKRHAQNAADTSALAGALAYTRADDDDDFDAVITTAAESRATSNGFDDGATNDVTVVITDAPSADCPANTDGKEITVNIVFYMNTTFTRVIGRNEVTGAVTATSRACGSYHGPPFNGNAIVSLAPSGVGFDAHGTPDWTITGGGIYVNSDNRNPTAAAICGGSAGITAPSITVVGETDFTCSTVNIASTNENTGNQISYSTYSALFPREPACDGTATFSGGQWHPEAGKDGSQVNINGSMDFAPGLYCVTNSPVNDVDTLTGSEVTFYMMRSDFRMILNGNGEGIDATAPTSGEYRGVLIYLAPQVDANGNLIMTQELDLRGNGSGDLIGTIIAPSADVTMFGNSGTGAYNSQVIGYQVDAGGNADITIHYQAAENYQATLPNTLTLLK
jgi:Flp pilus assembly protein TadG